MLMMKFMKLIKHSLLLCILLVGFLSQEAYSKSSAPVSELNQLKDKYPDSPIVASMVKREVIILPDEKGIPVMKISDEQIEVILSDNGADLSESKEYFSSKTEIKKFEAYSLVPEKNKYRKMPVPKLIKSTEFGDHLYYDDTYCYSFNFPAVGKGVKRCTYSEIEIKDPYHPLVFYFASFMPIDCAELTITIPESIKINFHLFGQDTASVVASKTKKGKMTVYKWVSHQSKVYDRDFMAPGLRYFRPHLIVQVASCTTQQGTIGYMGSIQDLFRWCESKTKGINIQIEPEVLAMTDSIVSGIEDTTGKVRAIYKWVQNNIKYIAIEDGENGFVPRVASLVLKRRYGDCKDKSSLLTAMIRCIGEKASLVTVGTRDLPYKYSEFPTIACANHMVAAWWHKNEPCILDGTARHNKLEDIPAFIQGKECVIDMGDGKYQLYTIPVANPIQNFRNDTIRLSIDKDLLIGFGKSSMDGETKINTIHRFEGEDQTKQIAFWAGAVSSTSDKLFVKRLKISDLNEINQPLQVDFEFQMPDYLVRQNNQMYINMNIERELSQLDVKNDRVIPIEVEFKKEHQITYCLKVPANMHVSYLPNSTVFNNPRFGFSHTYSQRGDEIYLTFKLSLNTLLIEGNDISVFREMLGNLKKAYRQTIILTNND